MFVELAKRSQYTLDNKPKAILFSTMSGLIFVLVSFIFMLRPEWVEKSQHRVVQAFNQAKSLPSSKLIYWAPHVDYSAAFYSKGHAMATYDAAQLDTWLRQNPQNMVVLNSEYAATLPPYILDKLQEVAVVPVLKKRYHVMRITSDSHLAERLHGF
jgi:hypothetical protein